METAYAKLQDDLSFVKGVVQVQDKQITANKDKIVNLTARSMSNNLLVSGILGESDKENCKLKILEFFRGKLDLTMEDKEVEVAHCIGKKGSKPRIIVTRCSINLKQKVLKALHLLKDVKNDLGDYYQIRTQLPEPYLSEKIACENRLKEIRKANNLIPEENKDSRVKAYIKNKTLFINEVPQKTHICPPTVAEVLNSSKQDLERMEKMRFSSSVLLSEKHSTFQGHAYHAKNTSDARLAYRRMKQLYPDKDHIMMVYAIKSYHGAHDDGEHGASKYLSQVLANSQRKDIMIFVTREFGGVHLGLRRFLLIEKAAKEALTQLDVDSY